MPTALITTFNSEKSFKTAFSTPEYLRNLVPPDVTTESIAIADFSLLSILLPSMLQVPSFHYCHHPDPIYIAVQRIQMEVPDHLLSLYASYAVVKGHKHHMNERGALFRLRLSLGDISMSDLESLN